MKKLIMTIAIVLSMGTMAFAQDVEVYEERGLFGMGKDAALFGAKGDGDALMLPDHGLDDDQDADAPLGTGIALLTTFGAAYAVARKRRKE